MPELNKKPLQELIKELIELYNKVGKQNLKNLGISINGNIDFLLENFKLMENSIDENSLNEVGEPLRILIEELISQLKKEVGIYNDLEEKPELDIDTKVALIDKKLKEKDISESDINMLLDERSELIKQQK